MSPAAVRRVIVAPHPDDEGQALGFLEDRASLLAVVTLTRGEATRRRPPNTLVESSQESPARTARSASSQLSPEADVVARCRVASWWSFLDRVIGTQPATMEALRGGQVWTSSGVSRFVFDAPDGALDPLIVGSLVREVLDHLSPIEPIELVLCGYEGDDYQHSDHTALAPAAPDLAKDNRVSRVLLRAESGPVMSSASASYYDNAMGLGGQFQNAYGWLAPNRVSWPATLEHGLFPRHGFFVEHLSPSKGE